MTVKIAHVAMHFVMHPTAFCESRVPEPRVVPHKIEYFNRSSVISITLVSRDSETVIHAVLRQNRASLK